MTGSWGAAVDVPDVGRCIAIVGVGDADHTAASGRTSTEIAFQAIERALADAGLRPGDVDGVMHGTMRGQVTADAYAAHFAVPRPRWSSDQGGAMRWGATAPALAAEAIRRGAATVVLNSFAVAWATEREQMVGGPGESHAAEMCKRNFEVPVGWFPQPVYVACMAQRHMHDFGTTIEQLGAVAVHSRRNAQRHPQAVMRDRPLTLADYLASPMIVDPFRKEDCCLISDGGGAFVMADLDRAAALRRPVVEVAGVGLGSSATGLHCAQQDAFTTQPTAFAVPGAYRMAGVTPTDLDVVEIYDPFTWVTLASLEDLGFCAKGEGGPLIQSLADDPDRAPVAIQTHGGLLSHAYVHGIAHITELVRQLRGDATNQRRGAEVGAYAASTGAEAGVLVLRRSR